MALSERIQVLFEPTHVARLQAIAESEGRSIGALIRDAVQRTYLDRDRADRLDAVEQMARRALVLPASRARRNEGGPEGARDSQR